MRVKVIRQKGQVVLVQWEGQRAYVPAEVVVDDYCPTEELEMGIPYGLPWAEIVGDLVLTGEEIEVTLRKHGIWTLEDARKEPMKAATALLAVHKMGVGALIAKAMNAMTTERGLEEVSNE